MLLQPTLTAWSPVPDLSLPTLPAPAAPITRTGDPRLRGATALRFSQAAVGTANPTVAGVAFAGESTPVVVWDFGGPVLGNQVGAHSQSGTSVWLDFPTAVSAFGIGLGFVNRDVTVEAYDACDKLLGSAVLPCSGLAIDGFLGLGGLTSPMASARVVTDDFIFIDKVQFVAQAVAMPGVLGLQRAGHHRLTERRRKLVPA